MIEYSIDMSLPFFNGISSSNSSASFIQSLTSNVRLVTTFPDADDLFEIILSKFFLLFGCGIKSILGSLHIQKILIDQIIFILKCQ